MSIGLLAGCSGEAELLLDMTKLSSKAIDLITGADKKEKNEVHEQKNPQVAKTSAEEKSKVTANNAKAVGPDEKTTSRVGKIKNLLEKSIEIAKNVRAGKTHEPVEDKNKSDLLGPLEETVSKLEPVKKYTYKQSGRRDPFRSGLKKKTTKEITTETALQPLQKIELSQMTLTATIWGDFGYRALVKTSDGKGYIIEKGMHLGTNHGRVKSITSESIIIEEKFIDAFGEVKIEHAVLKLHSEKEESE